MSGRGDLGALNKYTSALNVPFFSPRLIKSRIDLMNPVEYMKLDLAVRKIVRAQTVKMTAAILSTLALAKLAGAEVETDTESSDFGKIKVGNTRWYVSGGHMRYLKISLQLAKRLFQGDFGDAASLLLSEGRKNLSPAASFGVDAVVGEDVTGNEFNLTDDALKLVTLLLLDDLIKGYEEEGRTGSLKALPSIVGISTQTYGSKTGERYTREVLQGHRPASPKRRTRKPMRRSTPTRNCARSLTSYIGLMMLSRKRVVAKASLMRII